VKKDMSDDEKEKVRLANEEIRAEREKTTTLQADKFA
jgi:hypothetical protein